MLSLVTTSSLGPGNWPFIRMTFKKSNTKISKVWLKTKWNTITIIVQFIHNWEPKRNLINLLINNYLLRDTHRRSSSISDSPGEVSVRIICFHQRRNTQESQSNANWMEQRFFSSHYLDLDQIYLHFKTCFCKSNNANICKKFQNAQIFSLSSKRKMQPEKELFMNRCR